MKQFYLLLASVLMLFVGIGSAEAATGDVITDLSNLSTSKCYTIATTRGKMVANTKKTAVCSSHYSSGGSVTSGASTEEADGQWAIIKVNDTGYYFFNVGTKQFLNTSCQFSGGDLGDAFTISEATSTTNYKFKIRNTEATKTLNNNDQGSIVLDTWNDEDGGNQIMITEAGDFDASSLTTSLTVTYDYYIDGDKVYTENRTTVPTLNYPTPIQFGLDYVGQNPTPEGTVQASDAGQTFKIETTTISFPFKYSAEGTALKDLYWYRLKINSKYIIYDEDVSTDKCSLKSSLTDEEKSNDNYAFAFVGDPYNGFRILNYGKGDTYTMSNSNDPYDGNSGGTTYPTMKLREGLTISTAQGKDVEKYFIAKANNSAFYVEMKTYDGAKAASVRMQDRDNVLAYYNFGSGSASYFTIERVFLSAQETVDIVYNYQNNGNTIYTETNTAAVGQDLPAVTVPYGVTLEAPSGSVSSDKTTYDIDVTYSQESTGIKFFDSYDKIDTWYKWTKRNAWNNTATAYVYHINDATDCPFSESFSYEDSYLWAAIGNPYSFKICNKAAGSGYYLSNPNTAISDSDKPTMKQADGQSYFLYNCSGGAYGNYCFQVLGESTPTALNGNGTLNYWVNISTLGDEGSQMKWVEYSSTVKSLADLVQGQIYTITSAGTRGSFIYTENGLSSTYNTGTAADETDKNQQFMFVNYGGTSYLYSVGAGAFINITGNNEDNNRAVAITGKPVNTTLELVASTNSQNATYPVVLSIDGHHVGISTGFTPAVITHYNNLSDEGNALCIKALWGVKGDIYAALEKTITDDKNRLGTTLGTYTMDQTTLERATTISTNKTASIEDVFAAIKTISSDQLTLNMPTNGQFIRIKDSAGNYMTCNNTSSSRIEFSSTKDESSIFCYTGSALVAYKNGYYAATSGNFPCNATAVGSETTYHIHASSLNMGKYLVSFGGDTRFMFTAANAGTFNNGPTAVNLAGYEFTLEEVETVPVTITDAGMGTLYSPMALTIPDGVKAYTGTLDNENSCIKLTALEGTIPANTGVIIEGEAKSYDFATTTSTTSSDDTNCITGSTPGITCVSNAYTLQKVNDQLGFYKYSGTNLGGFKAYLVNNNSSSSKGYKIVKDTDPTGINGVEAEGIADGKYYDLQGKIVTTPLKNQIYILNGKKVLIK